MKLIRTQDGAIIECTDNNVQKLLDKGGVELSELDAHLLLFDKICHRLGAKFANYNHIDIASELYLWLLTKYQKCGDYAKDKSFTDNTRIWWSVATKHAYWIIREYHRQLKYEELVDEIPEDSLTSDYFEIEHTAGVTAITEYIDSLLHSPKSNEQQLGLFGIAKLNGLTDDQVCELLEIGKPRFFEIKRALKVRLRNFIGDNL